MNSKIYLLIDILMIVIYFLFSRVKPLISKKVRKEENSEKLIIIGNGPSLKNEVEKIVVQKNNSTIFCANSFANTEYFEILRPTFYFLADPMYWRDDVREEFENHNEKIFESLKNVNWNLTIVCPKRAHKAVSAKVKENDKIKVVWVRERGCKFNNFAMNVMSLKLKLCSPQFINVAVMALWYGICLKFKNIELYGLDFSSFKGLHVDQHTNVVSLEYNHFYKNSSAENAANLKYENTTPKMLHVRLRQVQQSFYQMYLLSSLAILEKVKVFNCSSFSYLDCFERKRSNYCSFDKLNS